MKLYNTMQNVGKVKYLVNYHDGIQKHKDGSIFFGVRCFSNKKKFEEFKKELLKDGYVYGNPDFKITKENIHLYYEFMSDEDLERNEKVIYHKLMNRASLVQLPLSITPKDLQKNAEYKNSILTIFGIKDTLKPIDEYIEEIKNSDAYKSYIAND